MRTTPSCKILACKVRAFRLRKVVYFSHVFILHVDISHAQVLSLVDPQTVIFFLFDFFLFVDWFFKPLSFDRGHPMLVHQLIKDIGVVDLVGQILVLPIIDLIPFQILRNHVAAFTMLAFVRLSRP